MKTAIGDMDFRDKSEEEVDEMLELRTTAALGQKSQGSNAKINIGRTKVRSVG